MIDENAIRARYAAIKDQLDERGRRLFVAAEKSAAGYGGGHGPVPGTAGWGAQLNLRGGVAAQPPYLGQPVLRAARSFAARRISLLRPRPRPGSGAKVPAGRFR